MEDDIAFFEDHGIRRVYDEDAEVWYFSVVDIIGVLTEQPDTARARTYWKVLKNRLKKEGSEVVTKCNQQKLTLGRQEKTQYGQHRSPLVSRQVHLQGRTRASNPQQQEFSWLSRLTEPEVCQAAHQLFQQSEIIEVSLAS
ncbi:MAG: hypothetical protein J1E80_06435 [Desulfovibrionaceae bacterium]|nr:hypothetical protein [Desulfovibrionaceae bacterium]